MGPFNCTIPTQRESETNHLTCDEGLIGHGIAFQDFPIHWELSPWNNLDDITPLHQLHGYLFLSATNATCYIHGHSLELTLLVHHPGRVLDKLLDWLYYTWFTLHSSIHFICHLQIESIFIVQLLSTRQCINIRHWEYSCDQDIKVPTLMKTNSMKETDKKTVSVIK